MGIKGDDCEVSCDELYCGTCHAAYATDNESERVEVELMFAKTRYEYTLKQIDDICALLRKAFKAEKETLDRYLKAIETKNKLTKKEDVKLCC